MIFHCLRTPELILKKIHLITMDFVQVLFNWLSHSGQTPLLAIAPPHATFSTSTVNCACFTRVYEQRPLKSKCRPSKVV